jgi:hypothetical protein
MLRMGLMTFLNRGQLRLQLAEEFRRLRGHVNKASTDVALHAAVNRLLGRYSQVLLVESLDAAARDVGAIAKAVMGAAGEAGEKDWEAVIARAMRAMLGYLGADGSARPTQARDA